MKAKEKIIREISITDTRDLSIMEVVGVAANGLITALNMWQDDREQRFGFLVKTEVIEHILREMDRLNCILTKSDENKSITLETDNFYITIEPAKQAGIYVWYKSINEWDDMDCITYDVDWCLANLHFEMEEA